MLVMGVKICYFSSRKVVVVSRGLAASLVSEVGVEIMVDTTKSPAGWRVSPFTVSMPTSVSPSTKKMDMGFLLELAHGSYCLCS